MNALTGAVDQHRAGPVKNIPCSNQIVARLQNIFESAPQIPINRTENAENSSYAYININV